MQVKKYTMKFEVKKVCVHKDNGFSILDVKIKEYDSTYLPTTDIKVKGIFPSVFEEDEFLTVGTWEQDSRFGWQFVPIDKVEKVKSATLKGITNFLKSFVKGVGIGTISKIVEYYKEDTLEMIEKGPEKLSIIKGVGQKKAELIHNEYMKNYIFKKVSMFFSQFDLPHKYVLKVYDTFGINTIEKIKENPYILTSELYIPFIYSEKIGFHYNLGYLFKKRLYTIIIEVFRSNAENLGHLFLYENNLFEQINLYLKKYSCYNFSFIEKNTIIDLLHNLVKEKKLVIEKYNNENIYYLSYYDFVEKEIVKYLYKINNEFKPPLGNKDSINSFIENYENNTGFKFAKNQKAAIYMALTKGMSVLTGGPGTGKTATINAIIQAIKTIKPSAIITLCAPTGRASKRMSEVTNMPAATIHRELGLLPSGDFLDEDMVLESDILIIDESSMIDAVVFYKTLTKIDTNTRILFVGDHEQLPSVGPGLILRDLIDSNCIPITKLNEIFRQAQESQIVMNSHAIINGLDMNLTFDKSKDDFYFIKKNDKMEVQKAILNITNNLIKNKGYKLSDIQILSPQKKGELGVYDLNNKFQELFNPFDDTKIEYKLDGVTTFRIGDRVIQTKNNYDLEVFNGDTGKILNIYYSKNELYIDVSYPDKEVTYDIDTAKELMLAYSITIHKSQGSEFPVVIIPVHMSQANMLTRNLIYTGVTRAKKMVILIGTNEGLSYSIKNNEAIQRNSLIKNRLIQTFS